MPAFNVFKSSEMLVMESRCVKMQNKMGASERGWERARMHVCAGTRMRVSILMHVKHVSLQNNKLPNHKTDASGNTL